MRTKYLLLTILGFSCTSQVDLDKKVLTANEQSYTKSSTLSVGSMSVAEVCQLQFGNDNVGNPIGGGLNYNDIVTAPPIGEQVSTLSELEAELQEDSPHVIYIRDDAEINVPAGKVIIIPGGFTLASGRGRSSCGALIHTSSYDGGSAIITLSGDNVRITGIRFQGPSGEFNNTKLKRCIDTGGKNSVKIDNCEFYNWPHAAVSVSHGSFLNIKVLNNSFHHNNGMGLGYGVIVAASDDNTPSYALIKGNVFSSNRHDITCTATKKTGYEASYNVCLGGNTMANFDLHGYTPENPEKKAHYAYIHHNYFNRNINPIDGDELENIGIHGRPSYMCFIEKNWFAYSHIKHCVWQNPYDRPFKGNVYLVNNIYSWDGSMASSKNGSYVGYYAKRTWNARRPFFEIPFGLDTRTRPSGPSKFQMDRVSFGDFNSDGKTEIFKIAESCEFDVQGCGQTNCDGVEIGRWQTTPFPVPEAPYNPDLNWTNLAEGCGYPLSQMALYDFNGNSTTDVMVFGDHLYLSEGASQSWQKLSYVSPFGLANFAFGNFTPPDPNNVSLPETTDVLLKDAYLSYSDGGAKSWQQLAHIYPLNQNPQYLATGYFNNDNICDVFLSTPHWGGWRVSLGGNSSWMVVNGVTTPANELIFADVDDDGLTDVIRKYNGGYQYIRGEADMTWINTWWWMVYGNNSALMMDSW